MTSWTDACGIEDIDEEDLITWEHDGHTYAIYNTENGFFASDGMCTHEDQSLEDGLVIDCVIECPLHGGRFDICTGKALSAPAYTDLKTYPVKMKNSRILIEVRLHPG
ncbi:MAG: non-heme iron oxygenase ferredoxin subunit [Rhodobacteraceae bacterium]|nr:non-heme iron oxygenase ferredoxin subunit [Paracoccaceae bacterium]